MQYFLNPMFSLLLLTSSCFSFCAHQFLHWFTLMYQVLWYCLVYTEIQGKVSESFKNHGQIFQFGLNFAWMKTSVANQFSFYQIYSRKNHKFQLRTIIKWIAVQIKINKKSLNFCLDFHSLNLINRKFINWSMFEQSSKKIR